MSISLESVVGMMTVICAVGVKLIGIPDQVLQNHRRRSTEGVSLLSHIMGFLAYVFWTLHGILRQDMVLIVGQFLGVVTTGVVLYQFLLYRKSKE